MDAVFSGSVASKVCEKCDTPLLLQPAAKQSTSKPLSS
jgi:hypothetical protein